MFLGLRMTRGVSKDDFMENFGCSMDEIYGPVLKRLEEQGLLETEGNRVRLTTYGLDVSNRVWVEFLL
jgi:oxygen-independent coproporphyrinogen-3 oxidase